MHKSIIVLLGLLIFLIPVGFNIMSNTTVLAFEDYGYDANQYEQYAMDMANDNNDRSQDNDFLKKVKCNNINSNINGNDNTINLGTGLGVGDESLQHDASADTYGYDKRNKGNFDLDCINNNEGGLPGPQGPQGPQGPEGPSGITVIDSSNFYSREGLSETATTTPDLISSIAECDEEDTAISGSFDVSPDPETVIGDYDLRSFSPVGTVPSNEWETEVAAVEGTTVTTTVLCFDNPPLNTLAAADAVSTFQQPEDVLIMSQAIENSPELTATEKITKLKTQWLDLLP